MLSKQYWLIIITYILMHLSGIIAVPFIIIKLNRDPFVALAYWNIIAFSIALIVILSILQTIKQEKSLRNQSTISEIVLWSFLGIFMAYGAQLFAGLIEMNLLGIDPGSENTADIMSIIDTVPAFIVIPTILAPILEEIVFRKVIFGSLYKRMNFFFAAIISSVVFGVIHFDFTHLLIYSAMGFTFAYLYVKTKRIIVPIIVHMGMNSLTVLAQSLIDPDMLEEMRRNLSLIFFGG